MKNNEPKLPNNKICILVYRVIFPDDTSAYEVKILGKRYPLKDRNIDYIAKYVREEVTRLLEAYKDISPIISIDFSPYHNIVISNGIGPRKSIALTRKEGKQFWISYIQ